jgi:small subunit ribosomal protein S20
MANIKSAKKRTAVIERKTLYNRRVKNAIKELLKEFNAAVADKDKATAQEKLAVAKKKLAQAAAKGVYHKNTASRKISGITKEFNTVFGKDADKAKSESGGEDAGEEAAETGEAEAEENKTEAEDGKPETEASKS